MDVIWILSSCFLLLFFLSFSPPFCVNQVFLLFCFIFLLASYLYIFIFSVISNIHTYECIHLFRVYLLHFFTHHSPSLTSDISHWVQQPGYCSSSLVPITFPKRKPLWNSGITFSLLNTLHVQPIGLASGTYDCTMAQGLVLRRDWHLI